MRLQQILRQLAADEEGASLVEYSILAGLVAAGAVVLINAVRGNIRFAWSDVLDYWDCADRARTQGTVAEAC